MNSRKAITDHPIQGVLSERWSPYAFDKRPVSESDLCSLFEAARWAASSYNAQPWSYIVATQDNPAEFARVLSCLVEPNQVWAKNAPVLALGIISKKFPHNKQDNRVALHDLGLAAGNLLVEATARGIDVHQMAGILSDKAREVFQIPENHEAYTGIAIGYYGDQSKLPDELKQRETAPRTRKPLNEFVFTGKWAQPAPFARKK
ncbi:MAG TPA: nitroreductase family protein [Verrucomicrobiae bacterium]|jgi:nitroreductase|nr:nitroreductase family protein [Verrucomicrobiae bacterium]